MRKIFKQFIILLLILTLVGCQPAENGDTQDPATDLLSYLEPTVVQGETKTHQLSSKSVGDVAVCSDGVLYIGDNGMMLCDLKTGKETLVNAKADAVYTIDGVTVYMTDGLYLYGSDQKIAAERALSFKAVDRNQLLLYNDVTRQIVLWDGKSQSIDALKKVVAGASYHDFALSNGVIYAAGTAEGKGVVVMVKEGKATVLDATDYALAGQNLYLLQEGRVSLEGKVLIEDPLIRAIYATEFGLFAYKVSQEGLVDWAMYDLQGNFVQDLSSPSYLAVERGAVYYSEHEGNDPYICALSRDSIKEYYTEQATREICGDSRYVISKSSKGFDVVDIENDTIFTFLKNIG